MNVVTRKPELVKLIKQRTQALADLPLDGEAVHSLAVVAQDLELIRAGFEERQRQGCQNALQTMTALQRAFEAER